MNAIILIIPLIIIRYGLPKILSDSANERTGFFPPPTGIEKLMLNVYKIATISLLATLFFFKINLEDNVNYLGLVIYLAGMLFYILSVVDFARANEENVIKNGVYKFSRNPMYVAFFLYFLGINLMINSWLYLILLVVFQVAVHFLILGEERWCKQEYGQEYGNYMQEVRRYL